MCGGGGKKGGSAPPPPAAPVFNVLNALMADRQREATSATEVASEEASRRNASRSGKRGYRTQLSSANVNVGGSGATGLNIPKSS